MKKILTTFLFLFFLHISAFNAKPQVYVVYLGEHSGDKSAQEIEGLHRTYIHHVKRSKEEASASLVHSYKNVINGFSALLTSEEATTLAEMDGVISVFPSKSSELHTTRSWDFINMYEGNGNPTSGEEFLRKAGGGKNVIIGMLDTGERPTGRKKEKMKHKLSNERNQFISAMEQQTAQFKGMFENNHELLQKQYDLDLLKAQNAANKITLGKEKMALAKRKEDNKILRINLNLIEDPAVRESIRRQQLQIVAERNQEHGGRVESNREFDKYFENLGGSGSGLGNY